eukprot:1364398-Amorphochlora_amoeboformis.AAC.2
MEIERKIERERERERKSKRKRAREYQREGCRETRGEREKEGGRGRKSESFVVRIGNIGILSNSAFDKNGRIRVPM